MKGKSGIDAQQDPEYHQHYSEPDHSMLSQYPRLLIHQDWHRRLASRGVEEFRTEGSL